MTVLKRSESNSSDEDIAAILTGLSLECLSPTNSEDEESEATTSFFGRESIILRAKNPRRMHSMSNLLDSLEIGVEKVPIKQRSASDSDISISSTKTPHMKKASSRSHIFMDDEDENPTFLPARKRHSDPSTPCPVVQSFVRQATLDRQPEDLFNSDILLVKWFARDFPKPARPLGRQAVRSKSASSICVSSSTPVALRNSAIKAQHHRTTSKQVLIHKTNPNLQLSVKTGSCINHTNANNTSQPSRGRAGSDNRVLSTRRRSENTIMEDSTQDRSSESSFVSIDTSSSMRGNGAESGRRKLELPIFRRRRSENTMDSWRVNANAPPQYAVDLQKSASLPSRRHVPPLTITTSHQQDDSVSIASEKGDVGKRSFRAGGLTRRVAEAAKRFGRRSKVDHTDLSTPPGSTVASSQNSDSYAESEYGGDNIDDDASLASSIRSSATTLSKSSQYKAKKRGFGKLRGRIWASSTRAEF